MVAEREEARSAKLPCEVWRGLFSNERTVRIVLPDGHQVTALVHEADVRVQRDLSAEKSVPGYVLVWVIGEEGDLTIVDLPQPGFEGGPRLRVPTKMLE
jgi:hypothetical protein